MSQIFRVCILNRNAHKFFKESRRYAGHSKWQNIKHQKAENDNNRATLFLQLRGKMKMAVLEKGDLNPATNTKLAKVIEQCKKVQMPIATINDCLKKIAEAQQASHSTLIKINGPKNCIMVIKLVSDNLNRSKLQLNTVLKKIHAKVADGTLSGIFYHDGIIIAEKKYELEKAMEDAINVEAIDIEEIEDDENKYFQFKCQPQLLPKITSQLKILGYQIVGTHEEIIPISAIKLTNEDLQIVKLAQEKLLKMSEVHEIYDNVDHDVTLN